MFIEEIKTKRMNFLETLTMWPCIPSLLKQIRDLMSINILQVKNIYARRHSQRSQDTFTNSPLTCDLETCIGEDYPPNSKFYATLEIK